MAIKQTFEVKFIQKGTKELGRELTRLEKGLQRLGSTANKTNSKMGTAAKSTENLGRKAATTGSKMARLELGMFGAIKAGVLLGVVWQGITAVLTTAQRVISDLAMGGVELEASLKGIEVVARGTGREFAEVMDLMTEAEDAFLTKTALAPGVLRLLSTSLSTDQISQFIQIVKDGSAAMGLQAEEQLPLLARGFKQLTANILDNIGVTINLNRLRRIASKDLGVAADALSETQLHQALFNEMVRQGEKFQGAYNIQLETAKGGLARVNTEWIKLTETVGNTDAIKGASNAIADLIKNLREWIELNVNFLQSAADFANIQQETVSTNRNLSRSLESYNKHLKETAREIALQGKTIEDFVDLSEEEIDVLTELTRLFPELGSNIKDLPLEEFVKTVTKGDLSLRQFANSVQESMDEQQSSIFNINRGLKFYRRELREVQDVLRTWTVAQRSAKRSVDDLNDSLERKLRVLSPELFPEATEDTLKNIKAEKDRIFQQKNSIEQQLKQTSSVQEYNELLTESTTLQLELERLIKDESDATSKLSTEVDGLRGQLEQENNILKDASSQVSLLSQRQSILTDIIDVGRDKVEDLNDAYIDHRIELEKLIEQYGLTSEMIESVDKVEAAISILNDAGKATIETFTILKKLIEDLPTVEDINLGIVNRGNAPNAPNAPNFPGVHIPFQGGEDVSSSTIFNQQQYSVRIGTVNAQNPEMQAKFFKGLRQSIGARIGG